MEQIKGHQDDPGRGGLFDRRYRFTVKYVVPFDRLDEFVEAVKPFSVKVPVSKKAQRCKDWFKILYSDAYTGKGRSVRGGSWRLPENYQKALLSSVQEASKSVDINFKHCMHDIMSRK